jgi:hypothetical protein
VSLSRTTAIAALVVFTHSLAHAQATADYSPTKVIAGTLPVTGAYDLTVKSPANLNHSGELALPNGIVTELEITAADFPTAGSEAEALSLVSLATQTLTFTALSQEQTVGVSVNASAGTTPGEYTFVIRARPPSGIGWGVSSGHTLNLMLSAPISTADITPPVVSFTAPTDNQQFLFCSGGTPVSLNISANDAESFVTAVFASVNGGPVALSTFTAANSVVTGGTYTATDLGVFTARAWATSAGGTSDPDAAKLQFGVNYSVSFLPPLSLGKTAKGGSTMPVKFTVRDCNSTFIADQRVTVRVYEGATQKFSATYGDSSSQVRIDTVAEQYITNFQTATGAHDYTVKVSFNGLDQATATFSVR